jgi:phage tail-like protein
MTIDQKATSSYLKELPAIFSEDAFAGRFLLAFEQVLTGLPDVVGREATPTLGLEEIIANLATLFDPVASWDAILPGAEKQKEFLHWLAGWVALGLRADWTDSQKRKFLSRIVSLYRQRGTKENLAELLQIYTGLSPVITVSDFEFQIGVNSRIGVNTQIEGGPPHFFHVDVTMPKPNVGTLQRQKQIAMALIDLQKPAHTDYKLTITFDTMQIGARSTIGLDTLLGNLPQKDDLPSPV